PGALSALVSKYVDAVIAATPAEIETFFSPVVSRSKVRDGVHALLAAREITTVQVGTSSMLQITPERVPYVARERQPVARVPSSRSLPRRSSTTDDRRPPAFRDRSNALPRDERRPPTFRDRSNA